MRSVLLVAAIALMSGAALATAQVNDNLPLSFHCGEAFITIHRTHIFNEHHPAVGMGRRRDGR